MNIHLIAIGQIKRGPERELVNDYLDRAAKLGRGLGIRSVQETEIAASENAARDYERMRLKIAGHNVYRLDERGEDMTSQAFAKTVTNIRDGGASDFTLLIGGADGFTDEMKTDFPDAIRFGRMTWPHKLVRVLAMEQIYRALSLMAGTPYHRE